ncbi:MAG: type II toxin-antitoxin system HicB family antitoxin [Candidatus Margulisiibacteriota bacterium]
MTYNFTIIYETEEEGGYHAFCPTLPGCHTFGSTIEEARKNLKEAIGAYLESLLKDGEDIPEEKDLLIGEMKLELAPA